MGFGQGGRQRGGDKLNISREAEGVGGGEGRGRGYGGGDALLPRRTYSCRQHIAKCGATFQREGNAAIRTVMPARARRRRVICPPRRSSYIARAKTSPSPATSRARRGNTAGVLHLSVTLYFCIGLFVSVYLSFYVFLSVRIWLFVFVCLSFCQSVSGCLCLRVCLLSYLTTCINITSKTLVLTNTG